MNSENSLWGDLPLGDTKRTPLIVLREQASILTRETNGLLEGTVITRTKPPTDALFSFEVEEKTFSATLGIVAPALDGYTFLVLRIEYDLIPLYPVKVYNIVEGVSAAFQTCEDETQLKAAVGAILTSDSLRKAIVALLAQSRSLESDIAA